MGKRSERAHSIRWYRLNAGLTADELALTAQVAPNTLRRLERGYRSTALGHEAERRVAYALGIPATAILFGAAEDEGPTLDLASEREARKLGEGEVAASASVPLRVLRRAEAGVAIAPRYALRLAAFYGCRVSDFYPAERREAVA
jgi:transcriptional regulator with XRE-family HTH domain